MTFVFYDFISGDDGVEIEGCAAFLVGESFNCGSNFVKTFDFLRFFKTRVVFFLKFYDKNDFRGWGAALNANRRCATLSAFSLVGFRGLC